MNLVSKVVRTLNSVRQHRLSEGRELRSMWDFVVAQLAARCIPGEVCVELANGTRLLVPPGMKGAAHFIFPGMNEFDEMAFLLHYLRPGDLFADIGANIGAYTVLAAGGVGARAIAFEPSGSTFAALSRNIALNQLGEKVRLRNVALGGKVGHLEFTRGLGTENYVVSGNSGYEGSTERIELSTMDVELAGVSPRLIKIDVEGFETEVFSAAEAVLANPAIAALIIERNGSGNRYGYDEPALHERIRGAGFRPCRYVSAGRVLEPVSEVFEGNVVYLRDPEDARRRVETAPSFRVKGRSF
jgi:FkbM family methyltransferase